MAKKKEIVEQPKNYHYYCHKCKTSYDLDNLIYKCVCGSEVLTITSRVMPLFSGYFVKGVRK